MRILSRYVLTRFLVWFGILLVVLVTGVVVAEMLLQLDDLSESSSDFADAVRFLLLRVTAFYVPILIPITSFSAAFLALGLAARWLEVTAAKAGGISPWRTALPVLAAAALLSLVTLAVNETLVIGSLRAWHRHESAAEGEIEFRRGRFWYHTGPYFYNVGDGDPSTRTLRDVRIFETNPEGRLVRRVRASLAEVQPGSLVLYDATVHSFEESPMKGPGMEWKRQLVLETGDTSDPALLDANAETLSLLNLREFIQHRIRSEAEVSRFLEMFHRRLSDPFVVFVLALIAIPFALRAEFTKSLAVPALQGVVLLLVFWSLRAFGRLLGDLDATAAVAAPWTLLVGFAVLGVWRLARVPR